MRSAEHRVVSRDRNTVLRWPDFEPIMLAILDVNKRGLIPMYTIRTYWNQIIKLNHIISVLLLAGKERYEKLTYDEIRWQI
jgi:hypothetical protein